MQKKQNRRRYYLHSQLKHIARIRARRRTIEMAVDVAESLEGKPKEFVNELISLGYNIQMCIPDKDTVLMK